MIPVELTEEQFTYLFRLVLKDLDMWEEVCNVAPCSESQSYLDFINVVVARLSTAEYEAHRKEVTL